MAPRSSRRVRSAAAGAATAAPALRSSSRVVGRLVLSLAVLAAAGDEAQDDVGRMAAYLRDCVASLPDDAPGAEQPLCEAYAETPRTNIGRHLRCLAKHPSSRSIAMLFYGNPCQNGVLSAAMGLREQTCLAAWCGT
mmetsp:Transcript_166887/g.530646  ORF Transcript_166887/g.530646 Transcript_166887/m.530646 type:complete len:137 (-) Transcript_166887:1090-1500(-)